MTSVLLNRSLELSRVAFLVSKDARACKLTEVEVKRLQTFHGENVNTTLSSSWGMWGQPGSLSWCLTYYTALETLPVFVKNLTWRMQQGLWKCWCECPEGFHRGLFFPPSICWQNVSSNNALWLLQPDGVFDMLSSPASGFPNCMTGRLHFTVLQNILPSCLVSKKQLSLGTPTCAGTSEGQGGDS